MLQNRERSIFWTLAVLSLPAYFMLLYGIERTAWPWVLGCFAWLFGVFWGQIWITNKGSRKTLGAPIPTRDLFLLGIAIRLFASFALPELSDDYFRFVWDGRLWNHGINPFGSLPAAYMQDPVSASQLGLTQELFTGLNSPEYYTIYPPVLQFIFWLATALFPQSIYGSVLVMKAFILLAEAFSLWLILKLLTRFSLPKWWLAFYALNPLVIVELTGNLHFEALMISFLLGSIWFLARKTTRGWWISVLLFALAVATKLIPLIFLPLLIKRLGWWKAIGYGAVVMGITMLLFLPILDPETVANLSQSIDLYFHRFEFNASLYYVVRWIGYEVYNRNIILTVGSWFALAALIGILLFALLERKPSIQKFPAGMMWTLGIYFLFATIVHPWYAVMLVAGCSLSRWRWPLVFATLVPLSYYTYRDTRYEENLYFTAIIYLATLGFMAWEFWQRRNKTLKASPIGQK